MILLYSFLATDMGVMYEGVKVVSFYKIVLLDGLRGYIYARIYAEFDILGSCKAKMW